MSAIRFVARGSCLITLIALLAGCVIAPGPRGGYHEGYYDRAHHRYWHDNGWHDCHEHDAYCH
jgi:hypothetical protein